MRRHELRGDGSYRFTEASNGQAITPPAMLGIETEPTAPLENSAAPAEIVLRIIEMLCGERSREEACKYIHPLVTIHMDTATHRGLDMWQRWVYLIRNCGRYRQLRFVPRELSSDAADPCVVNLVGLWAGVGRVDSVPREASYMCHFRYRFEGNRAVELWTLKSNYEFILGPWIRFSVFYGVFLGWAILHFKWLARKGLEYRFDRPAVNKKSRSGGIDNGPNARDSSDQKTQMNVM